MILYFKNSNVLTAILVLINDLNTADEIDMVLELCQSKKVQLFQSNVNTQ